MAVSTKRSIWHRIYNIIFWVPPNCRWDPENPPGFSMSLNFLFAFAGAFTVANLCMITVNTPEIKCLLTYANRL